MVVCWIPPSSIWPQQSVHPTPHTFQPGPYDFGGLRRRSGANQWPKRAEIIRFSLGWVVDLRLNVAGAPQNSMARAEKYEAPGWPSGHFRTVFPVSLSLRSGTRRDFPQQYTAIINRTLRDTTLWSSSYGYRGRAGPAGLAPIALITAIGTGPAGPDRAR